ncbi:hypothetical protein JET18_03330 [Chryseobacterium sp. L7]|uniref:Uncharacterized protein n=1 Tax=Chryseobacterium endalhagicum TaxID=2797638 RepID=A0ABS1QC64_9FLAO|nr:hypothetical protein [Chryseobacterium endalhagicum]MBL1219852.1 hypothetical protein [Chryseobacterium endalhagicum]
MKKFLLTATMLVGLSAVSKAQQGRVGINTTTPSATLDVVANTTDNARPDALLVPRMTAAELASKDDTAGTYGAPQNGAIVYITSGTGTGPRKAKITGAGFYYFDNTVPEWKPFGGGTVTTTPFRILEGQAASQTYDWTNTNFDYWEFTSGGFLNLGNPAQFNGRTIHVRNSGAGAIQFTGTELTTRPRNFVALTSQSAIEVYSNGTSWYLISGRN